MSERRLATQHIEADPLVTLGEIALTIRTLEVEMHDPDTMPRLRDKLDKRIGHLVFEYHQRKHADVKQDA